MRRAVSTYRVAVAEGGSTGGWLEVGAVALTVIDNGVPVHAGDGSDAKECGALRGFVAVHAARTTLRHERESFRGSRFTSAR